MVVVGSTVAAIDYIVKTVYSNRKIQNLAERDRPFFNRLAKIPRLFGKKVEVPTGYGNAQGISNTFIKAQENVSPHLGVRWQAVRKVKYGYYTLDGESMHATKNDEGAFTREVRKAMDSLVSEMGKMMAIDLVGNGSGKLSKVASVAALVITLDPKDDAFFFSKDMQLEIWTLESGGSQRTGIAKVTAVDKDAGTIDVDAMPTGTAAGDFIFREGDRGLALIGLDGWVPKTAPTATLHYEVDRTVDKTALGGHRVTATAVDLDEALLELGSKIRREGGRPDSIYMNSTHFTNLVLKLGVKVERDPGGEAVFGFDYIRMATPAGTMKVVEDPFFPSDRVYMIEHATTYLLHLESLPHLIDDDGNTMMRLTDADAIEFRNRAWWSMIMEAPGHNGVVSGL